LLNALLNEERAIVSDIAGTTRDTIEDEIVIGGTIGFGSLILLESGIPRCCGEYGNKKRLFEKIEQASVVVLLVDGWQIANDPVKLKFS